MNYQDKKALESSLTGFIKHSFIERSFKDSINMKSLNLDLEKKIVIPIHQKLLNDKINQSSLIGTAFDYLIRLFILKKSHKFKETLIDFNTNIVFRRVEIKNYIENINFTSNSLKELIDISILCALSDRKYRGLNKPNQLGHINHLNLIREELKNLLLNLNQDLVNDIFNSKKILLGSDFKNSIIKADLDLVIDDTIIDIKTVLSNKINKEHIKQIIGYYALFKIYGINTKLEVKNINNIGIYSSRYSSFIKIPIKNILTNEDKYIDDFKSVLEMKSSIYKNKCPKKSF